MFLHEEPIIVFKLFHRDPDFASQTSMTIELRLQFLFLAAMYKLHALSVMHSLAGNHTASFRDPNKIIKECKGSIPPALLA